MYLTPPSAIYYVCIQEQLHYVNEILHCTLWLHLYPIPATATAKDNPFMSVYIKVVTEELLLDISRDD